MRHKSADNLCAVVTAQLGCRIVSGEIRPGEPVPTQAELCAALRVSRTTVREAMMRLHGKGLVAARTRDGVRVQPTLYWNQFDSDILAWRTAHGVDAALLDQLYEIRGCFEPRACALAALYADDADRAEIAAQFATRVASRSDGARRIAADLAFHLAIFAATRNMFFVSLGSAIRTALALSFRIAQDGATISDVEMDLHRAVCDAVTAGDDRAADHAMRALLTESRATLQRALQARKDLAT